MRPYEGYDRWDLTEFMRDDRKAAKSAMEEVSVLDCYLDDRVQMILSIQSASISGEITMILTFTKGSECRYVLLNTQFGTCSGCDPLEHSPSTEDFVHDVLMENTEQFVRFSDLVEYLKDFDGYRQWVYKDLYDLLCILDKYDVSMMPYHVGIDDWNGRQRDVSWKRRCDDLLPAHHRRRRMSSVPFKDIAAEINKDLELVPIVSLCSESESLHLCYVADDCDINYLLFDWKCYQRREDGSFDIGRRMHTHVYQLKCLSDTAYPMTATNKQSEIWKDMRTLYQINRRFLIQGSMTSRFFRSRKGFFGDIRAKDISPMDGEKGRRLRMVSPFSSTYHYHSEACEWWSKHHNTYVPHTEEDKSIVDLLSDRAPYTREGAAFVILRDVLRRRPYKDLNRMTALLCSEYALVGHYDLPDEEICRFLLDIESGKVSDMEIMAWIREHSVLEKDPFFRRPVEHERAYNILGKI